MRTLVVDASALVEYLLRTARGVALDALMRSEQTHRVVPALCDVEVLAACRRGLLRRELSQARVAELLEDYRDLPLERHPHTGLLDRMLELHANFSAYDAVYVALAEALAADLVTADAALARAVERHTGLRVAS